MPLLTKELIKSFTEIVKEDKSSNPNPISVYGTVRESEGVTYVKIDGSEYYTPVEQVVDAKDGDRVLLTIDKHSAVVIGNYTYPPSARDTQEALDGLGTLVTDFEEQTSRIEEAEGHIKLAATKKEVEDTLGDYYTIDETKAEITASGKGIMTTVQNDFTTKNEFNGAIESVETTISSVNQTAEKINWVVKSGTSASDMTLTDKTYSLISGNIDLTADHIDLHGYITANEGFSIDSEGNMTAKNGTFNGAINGGTIDIGDGAFKVANTGNLKIGGLTPHTINSFQRAQLEITSSGTVYSVASDETGAYTMMSEGKITASSGASKSTIKGDAVNTPAVETSYVRAKNGSVTFAASDDYSAAIRLSGGACYFDPSPNNEVRLGSTTYYWKIGYITEGVKTGSDRTIKENIQYLPYDISTFTTSYSTITTSDCLKFITDDYILATYNYIGDEKTKVSAIAQDLLVNADGSDNIIGQMIVDCEEAVDSNGKLSMNQTQLINVLIGAVQELNKEVETLKQQIYILEQRS